MPRRVPRREYREVSFVPLAGSVLAAGLSELVVVDESILPGLRVPPSPNHRTVIQVVRSGEMRLQLEKREYTVTAGGLLATAAGQSWATTLEGSACQILVIFFGGPWAERMDAGLTRVGGSLHEPRPPSAVMAAVERIVRLGLSRQPGWDWEVLSGLGTLAAHLVAERSAGTMTARVGDLIDRNPADPWRLDGLAAAFGLSLGAFTHAFRSETGEGPASWVRRRRMDNARRQLGLGIRPVEVARQFGFPSLAQFSRCFSTTLGMTPSSCRP